MKQINRMKYTFALCFLLTGLLPSASLSSFAAATPNPTPVLLYADEEVEMAKQNLKAAITDCMAYYSIVRSELEEKASEEEAPELYQKADEIARDLETARYRLEQVTTMNDVMDMKNLIAYIDTEIRQLRNEIEELEVDSTMCLSTSTIDS